ncbi:hypothetical protein M434DRAFT_398208 [Hypoxylon sp. CO27-5]|nr:hypothetical protein M434DRAFT_398208 [Hypoxylon sp. CO27-5]
MATFDISDCYTPAIFTLIAILTYQFILYPAIFSPLSKVPKAHWSCSISPVWILWARFKSRENRTLHAAHQQHGPIVRIGPNELSVNSVDAVKTIYQGGFDKHQWYSLFDNYGVPCMFSSLNSKHHSLRKRWVSHVYSKSHIHASPALSAQASTILNARLLPLLRASAHASQAPHGIDVHSLFCGAAMDFISAYCFGLPRSADFIRRRALREHWLALYATRKGHGFFAQELPGVSRAFSLLGIRLTPSWVDAANRELEDWCKERCDAAIRVVEREREREEGRGEETSVVRDTADDPVVVRALMAGIEKEFRTSGEGSLVYDTAVRRRDLSIASEVFDHVLAGQETTGVALTYLSYHLSQSLDLQRKLREELLTLKPNMQLDRNDKVKHPDSKQLDNLPTLHAVIMETVRRYAPAGGPEPRVTPQSSPTRLGPYEIPGGVRVSASAYNLHRDETAFPDPEKWDHTRWLRHRRPADADGLDGDEAKNDIYRHFWGFSSGGRMCLGSNFAIHDMKLIIAAIYSNYTSHIVDDEGIEPTDAYTGHPKSNSLYLRFERVVGN